MHRHALVILLATTSAVPVLASDSSAAPVLASDSSAATAGTAEMAAAATGDDAAITVTATRTAAALSDVPATVSVFTAEDIENNLVEDIRDLVRFEPGVTVRVQPARFGAALGSTGRDGNSGFNIRGLEGNRVLIQTDGIRLPDGFAFGAQSVGRGDYADLDLLKSVEILRGPASALYGSDGLAGAVSFTTRDPDDLVAPGQNIGIRARLGHASADDAWNKGLALGMRDGDVSALVAYSRRNSGATANKGSIDTPDIRRTTPNPQDVGSDAVLAKLVWQAAPGHRVRATYEHNGRRVDSDVLSARAVPPLGATSVIGLRASDTSRRNRYSLDWAYAGNGFLRSASIIAFHQDSVTRQFSAEDRNIAADRIRDNRFDNRVTGLSALAQGRTTTGTIVHDLLIGGDYNETRQSGIRAGTVPPPGETFPTSAFPVTDYSQAGVFVQDSIDIGGGRLLLYPALRLDHYRLAPRPDPLFPGQTTEKSDQRLSPKIGAVWWPQSSIGVFGSYTQGFRSPTPSQVNNGFTNPLLGYASIPNPELRPETSTAFEAGVRLRDAELGGIPFNGSLTGFTGQYRDFIEQVQVGGGLTPADPGIFQFINTGRVRIMGVEMRLEAALGSGFALNLAAAYADGVATSAAGVRSPLSSINPFNIVGGLAWRGLDGRAQAQLFVTHSAGKQQADVAEACSPACFTPPGFTIADATAAFAVTPNATIRVGIFNIFDAKYFWWNDVRGLAANSPVTDAFSQPGRNASVSLIIRY
jgi:hemoglobin/transferrin/lactoferrin receptor protein